MLQKQEYFTKSFNMPVKTGLRVKLQPVSDSLPLQLISYISWWKNNLWMFSQCSQTIRIELNAQSQLQLSKDIISKVCTGNRPVFFEP